MLTFWGLRICAGRAKAYFEVFTPWNVGLQDVYLYMDLVPAKELT